MRTIQRAINWVAIATGVSHLFCCIFPTLFALISLFASLGALATVPNSIVSMHDIMHDWELPMLIASCVILLVGWSLQIYSMRVNCHDTGCQHGPCTPKKIKTQNILKIATLLFCFNALLYFSSHDEEKHITETTSTHKEHNHALD